MKTEKTGRPLEIKQRIIHKSLRLKLLCPCAFWIGQALQAEPALELDTDPCNPLESAMLELPAAPMEPHRESEPTRMPAPMKRRRAQPHPINDTLIQGSVPILLKPGSRSQGTWTDCFSGTFKAFVPIKQTPTQWIFTQGGVRYTQYDRVGGFHLGAGQHFFKKSLDIGYHAFIDALFNGSIRGSVGGSCIRDYLQGAINLYVGVNTITLRTSPVRAASGGSAHLTGFLPSLPMLSGSFNLSWYPETQVRFPFNKRSYACDSPLPLGFSLHVAPVPFIKFFGGIQWNVKAPKEHWDPSFGIRLRYRMAKSFKAQCSFKNHPGRSKRNALRKSFIQRESILLRDKPDTSSPAQSNFSREVAGTTHSAAGVQTDSAAQNRDTNLLPDNLFAISKQYGIPGKLDGTTTEKPFDVCLEGLGYELQLETSERLSQQPVLWTSSDPKIATITADGRFTRRSYGPVTFTATSGQYSSSVTFPAVKAFFDVDRTLWSLDSIPPALSFQQFIAQATLESLQEHYGDFTQYPAFSQDKKTVFWVRGNNKTDRDPMQTSWSIKAGFNDSTPRSQLCKLICADNPTYKPQSVNTYPEVVLEAGGPKGGQTLYCGTTPA